MSMVALSRFTSTAARRQPILSIRARLVMLALLIVVPLMLDRVRLMEASRAERIDHAASEALDLAKRGADTQREIMTTVRGMLQVMARAYVTMLARGESCNTYLTDLAANMPWIKGMSIVGPDGRINCASLPSAIGLDMSHRRHYLDAIETREFVVSDYLMGRVTQTPALIAAYPAQAIDAAVNAVVVASVDLQWINAFIGSLERRPGSNVLLVGGTGTVFAGDASSAPWIGTNVNDTPLAKEIAARGEGTAWVAGFDGVRRVFGFRRVPASDAHFVVGLNESEVLKRIDGEIMVAYLQLGFFGLLVLLVAWFGSERLIVNPIHSLAQTAIRFGRGDLDVRPAQQVWATEFEPLVVALNDMACKLSDREQELRAANRHLEELASLDSLSGLANRRGFDTRLAADWRNASGRGRPLALLMIDVDHFKLFNDCYGHVEGDVCLQRVGKLLEAVKGPDDLPARYGGEEFALLMPGADLDQALAVAERLRRAVEELCIAHAACPNGRVTISVGVAAMMPGIETDPSNLIEAADAGLYSAKRRGRNCVVAHGTLMLVAAN
jgi:diguanylate cyclase (GGDEF)-like protein